jgi:hypothetical protein
MSLAGGEGLTVMMRVLVRAQQHHREHRHALDDHQDADAGDHSRIAPPSPRSGG